MQEEFPGIGRKRPQLNISIDQLVVDNQNPRLAEEYIGKREEEILSVLYEQFDLDELAFSMVNYGYFDEEPIVVVPINLPEDFKVDSDINKLQVDLEDLAKKSNLKFKVLEGNRRTATAKILLSSSLRKELAVTDDFPKIEKNGIANDLKLIPAIVYLNEEEVAPYLGVRHISGNLRWEAFAKAIYLAKQIEKEKSKSNKSITDCIGIIKKNSADKTDSIRKQYTAFRILKELEEKYDFNAKNIKTRFSLITEVTNKPEIREYISLNNYNAIDFDKEIITKDNYEKFKQVFIWVFGNGKEIEPLLKDSRLIGKRLAPILADESATEHLIKYGNIEEAYERSGGEGKYFNKQLHDAQRKIQNSLSIAYKFRGNPESLKEAESLLEAAKALYENLKQ